MIGKQQDSLKKSRKAISRFAARASLCRPSFILALSVVYILGFSSAVCFAEPGWKMYKPSGIVSEDAWEPQQPTTIGAEMALQAQSGGMMAMGGVSTSEAEITPEIEELARGLQYDPTLIYRHVYNHVEFVPVYGANNGATGTLLSGKGSDWDQTSLLIALLRASGYSANYMYGPVVYTLQYVADRLGVPADKALVGNILSSGGWKDLIVYTNDYVQMHRVWAIVTIGSFGMMFDPAFKEYEVVPGIDNLTEALGYDRASFLGTASQGATIGGNYVQGVNWSGIESDLQDYSMNLVNWIKDNAPNAAVPDIVGGRRIIPKNVNYSFSLPGAQQIVSYQIRLDIPQDETLTLAIDYHGINHTFRGYEIAGKRVTLFHTGSGNAPELRVDGDLLATGDATNVGETHDLHMEVDHPYTAYSGFPPDYGFQDADFPLTSPHSYAVAFDFAGTTSQDLIKVRHKIFEENKPGNPDESEAVLGESLNIMALNWVLEVDLAQKIVASLGNIYPFFHHHVGIMAQEEGYYIDVKMTISSSVSIEGSSEDRDGHFFAVGGVGSALEHGILEQLQDGKEYPGVSTVKLLTLNNKNGGKTYYGDSDTYFEPGGLREILLNSTYTEDDLSSPDGMVNKGYDVVLPENPNVRLEEWEGLGYIAILDEPGVRSHGYIISGGFWGGFGAVMTNLEIERLLDTSRSNNRPFVEQIENRTIPSSDPVDIASGAFLHDNVNLSLGMDGTKGLQFARSYRSSTKHENRTMGHGWSHSYDIRIEEHSHGEVGLGSRLPVDAASAIAGGFVAFDLMRNDVNDLLSITACTITQKWIVDQLIDNAVTVHLGNRSSEFIRLANGSYSPPPGITDSLIHDGSFRLEKRFGTVFNFAPEGYVGNILDANGNTLTFGYSGDKLQTVQDDFGHTLTLSYNGDYISSVSDSTGRSVFYQYSGDDLTTYTDPEGHGWSYSYSDHLMETITDPLSELIVTNLYDDFGRVKTQTNGNNKTYQFYFSTYRNIEEDPDGNPTIYYFDDEGRQIGQEDALGNRSYTTYDGQGHAISVTDPRENTTQFEYDGNHNRTKMIDPLSNETVYTYDARHRLRSTTDPLEHATYFDYDAEHHLTLVTDPEENETSFTYYPNGLVHTKTDDNNVTTTYIYDSYGNLASEQTGSGDPINYTYNARGWLEVVTDQHGAVTQFNYDKRGLMTSKIDPEGNTTQYQYYSDGNLQWKKYPADGGPLTITYTYTGTDQVDIITYPFSTVDFDYDNRDNIETMTDSLGTTTYAYYNNNWLQMSTNPYGFEVRYQYDEAGNLDDLTYPGSKVVHYEYDELNRLHRVTPWVGQPTIYSHDNAGRLERCDLPNGTAATYSYDDASRLTDLFNQKSDASTISSYHFTLDGVGNRTGITRTEPFAPMFSPGTIPYTYSDNHHLLVTAGDESFSHDRMGNIVSRTGGTPVSYYYDYEQRLECFMEIEGYDLFYYYDGLGQRLVAYRWPPGGNTHISYYILDASGNVLAETDNSGNITGYYIYGLGLVTMITDTDQVYTYHFNAVGSTMAITDASEKIVNKYSYLSFGAVGTEVETIQQPFKFVGQHGVMAEPNGLYFMRARYYDPGLGRFLQPDPLGFAGGDVNLYVYASNNPILFIDPWGLCSKASNKHFYAAGVWNKNTSLSAQLGQGVSITTKNVNVLGTTISVDSNFNQAQQTILLPQQEHVFDFSVFSTEPVDWRFNVTTNSDAFIILYKIESTWVPGMPPNQ